MRPYLYCVFLYFAAAGALPAQRGAYRGPQSRPEQAAAVNPEERGSIEGTVVNGRTGEPIRKAQVLVTHISPPGRGGARPVGTSTDSGGRFVLEGVDPGRYRLTVTKNGFARTESDRTGRGGPFTLTVEARQKVTDLVIRLTPSAVITGRVTDEDGEPLANVRVQALSYHYLQGRRQLVPRGAGSTDDRGVYRMHGLQPGSYFVNASYSDPRSMIVTGGGSSDAGGEGSAGYAPVYYPGVLDIGQSAPLKVEPGQEMASVDFRLTPTKTFRVRGKVVNGETGAPVPRVSVSMVQPGTLMHQRSFGHTNQDGVFEIRGVIPGSYIMAAVWSNSGAIMNARRVIEVAHSDLDEVQMVLRSGVSVKGRLRLEDAPGAVALESVRVSLLPAGDIPMVFVGSGSGGAVGADGSFEIKNVGFGDYRVNVSRMPESFYLKGVRFGDAEALEKFSIGEAPGGALEIVMSGASGRVDGVVQDRNSQPAAGATIVLVPEGPRENWGESYKTSTTDQNGRFALSGIAPGDYKLFAWDAVEAGAYQDPVFRKPYEDRARKVTVEANGYHTVEVRVIEAGEGGR